MDKLEAPEKSFYTFYNSAHSPLWEENDLVIEAKIIALGVAYVSFFIDNPEYFTFLFDLCTRYFDEKKPGLSDYEKELDIIRIWSSVQGVTSVIFMKNVKWSHNWKDEIKNIIR